MKLSNPRLLLNSIFLVGVAVFHLTVLLNSNGKSVYATSGTTKSFSSGVYEIYGSFTSKEADGKKGNCPFSMAKAFITGKSAFISPGYLFHRSNQKLSFAPSKLRPLSTLNTKNFPHFINGITSQLTKTVNFAKTVSLDEKVTLNNVPKKKKKSPDALEVLVIGLSHHNAGVDVREKLAIPEANWNEASAQLCEYDSISEAAVLSTCNRFEIYLSGQNQYECMRDAIDFLYKRAGGTLDPVVLRKNLFMLSGEDAIWHLLRVSAGLDSLVVGEGQILSQVKKAYEHGIENGGQAGKVVSRMLNTAVSAGKRVRTETGISRGAVSISSAAAEFTAMMLSKDCMIDSMKDAKIAIIGAGKMARLLLVHLQTQGVTSVTIVNRSKERVIELQAEFPDLTIEMKLMDEMWDVIKNSDVVYPSTAATTTIIDPEPLKECLSSGRTRPGGIQFVDISVPRNVHPGCSEISNAFCYNVDDLKAVVERNTAKRRREMLEAENILREEQGKFRLWQQSLGAIPTINRLQEKAENLRIEELQKASKKLAALSAKDLETVEKVTKGIVAKLLHGPMNHLRQQTEGDATRAAIQQVQKAFQLE
eukprot:gene16061-21810_t